MELSLEQQLAFDKYKEGSSFFVSGPGGTGKSLLIKKIYEDAIINRKRIQVCALTGCAALLLNCKAKTIHSWSGIGIASGPQEEIVERVISNFQKQKNWKSVEVLIIDEVSMMSLKIFEILNRIAVSLRNKNKLFGGIQVIFSGDFYQLPPVGNSQEIETCQFCFESELWNLLFPKENIILLKNIFRQKDEKYLKILNEIRNGKMYRSSLNLLLENVNKKRPDDIQPTKLYPRRNKVDLFNQIEMDKLTGESRIFTMQQILDLPLSPLQQVEKSKYSVDQINRELQYIENSLLMNKNVELKVGSQVMCTINTETPDGYQLCNGSRGVITSFQLSGIPVVLFKEGFEIPIPPHVWTSESIPGIGISHMPLILAWAMSIHKSQGMSIDVAEIDAGEDIFECGQTYVALSRVKSLEGLYLTSFDVTKIKMNNKVKEFYNKIV
jgi:ATP-dependent DNA helicase PIF1